MSIAMDDYGTVKATMEPAMSALMLPVFPFKTQCRMCGYEPDDAVVPPVRCPKCTGGSWERFAFPRSLLMQADHRAARARQAVIDRASAA